MEIFEALNYLILILHSKNINCINATRLSMLLCKAVTGHRRIQKGNAVYFSKLDISLVKKPIQLKREFKVEVGVSLPETLKTII